MGVQAGDVFVSEVENRLIFEKTVAPISVPAMRGELSLSRPLPAPVLLKKSASLRRGPISSLLGHLHTPGVRGSVACGRNAH